MCHSVQFYHISLFIVKFPSCGGSCAIKSPLVLAWLSTCFSFTVLRLRSTGMPFLFSLTVSQQLISLFWRWEINVHYDFGGCCVWGTGPLWTLFPSSEMPAVSMLSRAWALESAVCLLCDCECAASKTSSQHSSSCIATVTLWLISFSFHNQLWYLTWIQQASPLASGFLSRSLLHGCAVCTENVKFPYVWLWHTADINCTHLRLEIPFVCQLAEGPYCWNTSYVVCPKSKCTDFPMDELLM